MFHMILKKNSSPTESIDIAELIAEIDEKHDIVKDKKRVTGMPSDISFAIGNRI